MNWLQKFECSFSENDTFYCTASTNECYSGAWGSFWLLFGMTVMATCWGIHECCSNNNFRKEKLDDSIEFIGKV